MLQDHYRFLISENKDEYDVSIKTLLDLTLFIKGPRPGDIHEDYNKKWLMWREVDKMNIFGTLHNRLFSHLSDAEEGTAENLLFKAYMNRMWELIRDIGHNYYPDKCWIRDPAMKVPGKVVSLFYACD